MPVGVVGEAGLSLERGESQVNLCREAAIAAGFRHHLLRRLELGACDVELVHADVDEAEVVVRQRDRRAVAELRTNRERFTLVHERLGVVAHLGIRVAHVVERRGNACLVAELAANLECLLVLNERALRLTEPTVHNADVVQRECNRRLVAEPLANGQRLEVVVEAFRVIGEVRRVNEAEVIERVRDVDFRTCRALDRERLVEEIDRAARVAHALRERSEVAQRAGFAGTIARRHRHSAGVFAVCSRRVVPAERHVRPAHLVQGRDVGRRVRRCLENPERFGPAFDGFPWLVELVRVDEPRKHARSFDARDGRKTRLELSGGLGEQCAR